MLINSEKKQGKHKNIFYPEEIILLKPAFQNKLTRNSMTFRRGRLERYYEHAQVDLQNSSFSLLSEILGSTQPSQKILILKRTLD